MSIIDIILTGLTIIIIAALVICAIAIFLLVTWMQVNEGKDKQHGQDTEESRKDGSPVYKARRIAC